MGPYDILSREEIKKVLSWWKDHRRRRNPGNNVKLIVFRLACCCGLRSKEIRLLEWGDVILDGPRPVIRIRKDITKGREGKRRARKIPLWWDKGTWEDFVRYKKRFYTGNPKDPVVFTTKGIKGKPLARSTLKFKWAQALRPLGDRGRQLSIHRGRHTFISHALVSGRTLPEVRDAAGHASIATTDHYTHSLDMKGWGTIFEENGNAARRNRDLGPSGKDGAVS